MKENILRKIYEGIMDNSLFEKVVMEGDVTEDNSDVVCGKFILIYVEVDGPYTPIIIYSFEDRYQFYCLSGVGLLAEWIKAGETGGYHGMRPVGNVGEDNYISLSKLHGEIKRKLVDKYPLWTK